MSVDSLDLPLLARFKLNRKGPPFDHHKKVYFEIWDIRYPKRGLDLLVKFYDCKTLKVLDIY